MSLMSDDETIREGGQKLLKTPCDAAIAASVGRGILLTEELEIRLRSETHTDCAVEAIALRRGMLEPRPLRYSENSSQKCRSRE